MKLTRSQKDILTKALYVVLAVLAIVFIVSLVGNIGNKDDDGYEKINLSYTIGAIDKTTGRPVEDDCAMYTKDIIECTGIELYADFDSDIKYAVHFYDDNEVWLSCVENEGLNLKIDEMPEDAYGVRIVIYPQNDENDKISLFEKSTYKNQLTVKITNEEPEAEDSAA